MQNQKRKFGTSTSSFGAPGRVNHDSFRFYNSKMYQGLPREEQVIYQENPIPEEIINTVICKSSERMEELPDSCVHLMVTSPPYNVGKDYDKDLTLSEYRDFLKRVWTEVDRVLVPGGRICVNIANLGRKPYLPLHTYIIEDLIALGFLMRGEIIWNKAASSSPSTAWGSWCSARNPTLRDTHEYILVFSKSTFSRESLGRKNSISKTEFMEFTKSVWTLSAESARKIGHPAPFPIELPYRLIQLYSFEGDVVLDPFMGSGQTAIAAIKANRNFIGYEINKEYKQLCDRRIREFKVTQGSANPFSNEPHPENGSVPRKKRKVRAKKDLRRIT